MDPHLLLAKTLYKRERAAQINHLCLRGEFVVNCFSCAPSYIYVHLISHKGGGGGKVGLTLPLCTISLYRVILTRIPQPLPDILQLHIHIHPSLPCIFIDLHAQHMHVGYASIFCWEHIFCLIRSSNDRKMCNIAHGRLLRHSLRSKCSNIKFT